MKLAPATCCAGLLLSVLFALLVDAEKVIYDYRTGDDFKSGKNCVNADSLKTRYLQIEAFDYNLTPWLKVTWTQISDECGGPDFTPYSATMEYNGNENGDIAGNRLQTDMYICAPWGNYELEIVVKSTNGNNDMEKIAWEVEYGPDEYHIWDTLNTPFFSNANGALPSDYPYAPIPNAWDGEGDGTTYTWPLPDSEGYYSVMYSGPFPPPQCPDLYPADVEYVGCFDAGQDGWTTAAGPSGSSNNLDPAEPYRMFDGLGSGDDGVLEEGVMTLEKCASICDGYAYFGLESAVKCLCGNEVQGSSTSNCGLQDDLKIPEYKYLCSGDPRVLCGTDNKVSVYSLDGSVAPPAPTPPVGTSPYTLLGCSSDSKGDRVMSLGPYTASTMSAEICVAYCLAEDDEFEYFGTAFSQECFCSKTLSDALNYGAGDCDYPCAQNGDEICGGWDAISVYEIVEVIEPPPTPAPVSPVDASDYTLVGCSSDSKQDRVMSLGPYKASIMSAEICAAYCLAEDDEFEYFGTEYSQECFCSKTLSDALNYGAGDCNYPCAQNGDEICGGLDAISVYEIVEVIEPPPTPTPVSPADASDYTLVGCSSDSKQDRVMSLGPYKASTMSAEICLAYCLAKDAELEYFGTEYSEECFCGKTLSDALNYGAGDCNYPCAQNEDEICGGHDAISVYEII